MLHEAGKDLWREGGYENSMYRNRLPLWRGRGGIETIANGERRSMKEILLTQMGIGCILRRTGISRRHCWIQRNSVKGGWEETEMDRRTGDLEIVKKCGGKRKRSEQE